MGLGQSTVVQTLDVATDTTVTLSVGSVGTPVGGYQIDVVLNATIDEVDNLATPQNVDDSLMTLSTASASSRRGVRGNLSPLIAPITTENETGDDFLSKQNDLR